MLMKLFQIVFQLQQHTNVVIIIKKIVTGSNFRLKPSVDKPLINLLGFNLYKDTALIDDFRIYRRKLAYFNDTKPTKFDKLNLIKKN